MKSENRGPNPVDIHVGERLRSRRSLLGMTQEKLAEAVNLTFQQIQKYERGTNRVSASRLWQFSKILQVPVSYFFENYIDRSGARALAQGLADNDQDDFAGQEDIMARKETLDLVRVYYSIPDPNLRKDLLKMIRTMARSMQDSDK